MLKYGLVALLAGWMLSAAPLPEPGPVVTPKLTLTYYWLPG
jgi:hypothetical protein